MLLDLMNFLGKEHSFEAVVEFFVIADTLLNLGDL